MSFLKTNFRNELVLNLTNLFICISVLVLFFNRLFYCAPPGDEINNIVMSWHVACGERPWVDVWELFQSGNSFLSPFVYLFYQISDNTDGIIFFSRTVYFIYCCLLSIWVVFSLSKFLNFVSSIWLFTSIVVFAPFCLYYIWYDTVGITLMLLGSLLIYNAYNSSKHQNILFVIAGLIHALMSYAYPSFIFVAFSFVFILFFYKNHSKDVNYKGIVCYLLGATFVFLIFIFYILHVGFNQTIFSDSFILKSIFLTHDNGQSSNFALKFARTIYLPVKLYWPLIPIYPIFSYFFLLGFKKGNFYICAFAIIFSLLASIYVFNDIGSISTFYYTFYVASLGFIISLILWENFDNNLKTLFVLFLIPSFVAYFAVGLTSNDMGKSVLGSYLFFVFTVILLAWCHNSVCNFKSRILFNLILIIIPLSELYFFYTNTFMAGSLVSNNLHVTNGVRKGLYVTSDDKKYSEVECWVKNNLSDRDESIMVTSVELNGIYLSKNIKSASYLFSWSPYSILDDGSFSWNETKYYWKKISGLPSVIVDEYIYKRSEELSILIDTKYKKIGELNNVSMYRIKND